MFITLVLTSLFLGFTPNKPPFNNIEADIIGVRAVDIQGEVHRIGIENKRAYPVALVFIDIGCVISQRMLPYLNQVHEQASEMDVKFYGIISNPAVHWQEAQKFRAEFDIQFPLLFDSHGDLAHRLSPTVVPESFVFDIYDSLLYYGRINDQYADIGKFNKQIRNEDLLKAIRAASRGEFPRHKHQAAKGCLFESWDKADRTITFNQDIEPIIRANCSSCHQENGIGPFSLLTYEDVKRRARMVEYVTQKRYMPIWKAEHGYGAFSNEHRLSEFQIDLLHQWVANGMKEGKSDHLLPPIPAPDSQWALGEPDLILKMEPYELPANGDDQYRVFVIKDAIPKGRVIRALDFQAGDQSVVHHSTIFIDYTKTLRTYDAEDPKPGYDAFEKGGTMEFGSAVPVCGWAPGIGPYAYPEGVGFYVEEKADVAFENHYHLSGKASTDQSYIGIYFADQAPEKYITGSIMGTQKLQIKAGESQFQKQIWTYVPVDIELFDLTPHMHYIGKEVKVDVHLADGGIHPLLHITDWDLRWQSVYTLRELTHIPAGSIITASFVYDNSEDNHDNPYFPPQDMFWGWGSNDEMCEVYFSYIPLRFEDYGKMLTASITSFEHFYPAEKRIEVHADNLQDISEQLAQEDIWSPHGRILLSSIIESGHAQTLLDLLKQQQKTRKNDPTFLVNWAQLMSTEAYFSMDESKINKAGDKAVDLLYEVLKQDEEHWNASFSMGKLLLESGMERYIQDGVDILEAMISYQASLPIEDKHALPYWELGKYYYGKNMDNQAEAILRQGLDRHPTHPDLLQELASGGRIIKKSLH